jgi:hypothetical protein
MFKRVTTVIRDESVGRADCGRLTRFSSQLEALSVPKALLVVSIAKYVPTAPHPAGQLHQIFLELIASGNRCWAALWAATLLHNSAALFQAV